MRQLRRREAASIRLQRMCESFWSCTAISFGSEPSAQTTPTAEVSLPPAVFQRRKAMRVPSGDQSPSTASLTTLRGSPPKAPTRYSDVRPFSVRVNRIVGPAGENRAKSSVPEVSGRSSPPGSCLIQIRGRPSRSEVKAMKRPEEEAEGE